MPAIAAVKRHKRHLIEKYARPDDGIGTLQAVTTLLSLAALWVVVAQASEWPTLVAATLAMSLVLLRSFSLMHDCGHGSLFRTRRLNQVVGFLFGVVTGMPQYVWAQHHNYHHANNGNWFRYRGPLSILSVDEFAALSRRQQRLYPMVRTIWLAPVAGLMYLIVNPRVNWFRGTVALLAHQASTVMRKSAAPFKPRYWKTPAEFWHMTANNIVLLGLWAAVSAWIGAWNFFPVYLISVSLAGGLGIVLFTVQHNFEHSYAAGDHDWDYDTAAIEGTSYLALPGWLNWVTADIGYHHVHHISARIPNYRLAACHAENKHLFTTVKQLTLGEVKQSLRYLLWDPASRRIISIDQYEAARLERRAAQPSPHPAW